MSENNLAKLGYEVERYPSGNGFWKCVITVAELYREPEDVGQEKLVRFSWQTDSGVSGHKLHTAVDCWYAGNMLPFDQTLTDGESLNRFANLVRKIIRRLKHGEFESKTTPSEVLDVLAELRAVHVVRDRRRGYNCWVTAEVAGDPDAKVWKLMDYSDAADNGGEPSGYLLRYFTGTSLEEAEEEAARYLLERALWDAPDSRDQRRLSGWLTAGKPLIEVHEEAPDTRDPHEIVNDGFRYYDYNGAERDARNNIIEQVDEETLAAFDGLFDEEE